MLEERSGCFKIQRREAGNAREGKRPTITTKIRFAPSSSTEVLVLIGELKRKMADLGRLRWSSDREASRHRQDR